MLPNGSALLRSAHKHQGLTLLAPRICQVRIVPGTATEFVQTSYSILLVTMQILMSGLTADTEIMTQLSDREATTSGQVNKS